MKSAATFRLSINPRPFFIMKRMRWLFVFCCLPLILSAYTKESDSGLVFREGIYTLEEATAGQGRDGVRAALLVAPDDLPERKHFSNSSMARVEMLVLAPGATIRAHTVEDDAVEQIFIVLEGHVEITAGGETLTAGSHEIVFVPPGIERALVAMGDKPARLVQADWRERGTQAVSGAKAFIVSEKLRPLAHTGGEGYLTVSPNPRQQSNALSILSYGAGHINASNSLLLG